MSKIKQNKIYIAVEKFVTNEYVVALFLVTIFAGLFVIFKGPEVVLKHYILSSICFIILYFIALRFIPEYHHYKSDSMPVFDTDNKNILDEVIKDAHRELYLISPFLSPGNNLTEDILSRMREGVKVTMIINSNQLQSVEAFNFFERFHAAGGEMWHHPRLHSKIYLNESGCLITSLNLLTSSFDNSFEAGVASNNKYTRNETLEYIQTKLLKSDQIEKVEKGSFNLKYGYCIRTKQKINFNPARPIEYNEFRSNGSLQKGQYCHRCGKAADTSIENPFCKEHVNQKIR